MIKKAAHSRGFFYSLFRSGISNPEGNAKAYVAGRYLVLCRIDQCGFVQVVVRCGRTVHVSGVYGQEIADRIAETCGKTYRIAYALRQCHVALSAWH